MILSDGTIWDRFSEFFPPSNPRNSTIDKGDQIQPATVDMRLGRVFWVSKLGLPNGLRRINPRTMSGADYMTRIDIEGDEPFVMRSDYGTVLAEVMEWIEVPSDVQAEVDGKSSWGRHGLVVHATAGVVDAGFKGVITLELSLSNRFELELHPGDAICQVKFMKLDKPADRPYGHPTRRSKYQNQTSATPSLLNKDGER